MNEVLLAAGGPWQLAWSAAVIFVAYALRGATGFGAGMVSIPLLLLALPLTVVIPLVTAMGMLASLGQVVHQRRWVDWRGLRKLLLPSVAGVAAGLWLFKSLEPEVLRRALAVFIVGYALWGYLPRGEKRAPHPFSAWLGPLVGAFGGFVATVFGGMAGPLYALYLRSLALDKARFRATMSFALLCLSAARAAGYGGLGFYDATVLWLLAAAVPLLLVAMIVGDHWHASLDEARFGHVVAGLLVVSGLALLFK